MAVNLSPVGGVAAQFFDNSGNVLTGGKIYTYLAGTTTPAVTYTTSTGLTAQPNPIVLNAAGRVPDSGEIWLTDGISYKFVLKDQNDVLIATYDNVIGINSNFINFTGEEETQTATQGQTVFTLTTLLYQPGTNNLLVFVNGSKQVPGVNFNETSSTVVTFVDGLNVGDVVDFCTATPINTSTIAASAVAFTGFNGQVGSVQDLADDDGADWVGFLQDGVDAVAISAQDKMRQFVSVKDFGAVGNGVADDTTAFTNAMALGKAVYVPKGTYLLNFLPIISGVVLFGDGVSSVLKPLTADTYACISLNGGAASTQIENVSISNVKFQGDVVASGFSEFRHLVRVNGGRNVTFSQCTFSGFRGDGLYIGSGDTGGDERHNYNITVENCVFDGENNDNRNGISVIDGDGVYINNCVFKNCSKSDMPGAVDIEPDNLAFHIIKNITVSNCNFYNVTGLVACGLYMPNLPLDPSNINFINNSFSGCTQTTLGATVLNTPARQDASFDIFVIGNYGYGGASPFAFNGVKGLIFENNSFKSYTDTGDLGNFTISGFTNNLVSNSTIKNNSFVNCGTSTVGAITVTKASGLTITGNYFSNCGDASGGQLYFDTGSSDYVQILNNTFDNPGVVNTKAIWYFGHTFNENTNVLNNNTFLGTSGAGLNFPAFKTDNIGVTQNVFTPSTIPTAFVPGVNTTFVNSPSGGGLPGAYTQGMLYVDRVVSGVGAIQLTTSRFIPIGTGSQLLTFYRYANSADTGWDAWRTITAT